MHMSASYKPSFIMGCGAERSPSAWTMCRDRNESGSAISIDAVYLLVPSLFAVAEVRQHAGITTRQNTITTTTQGQLPTVSSGVSNSDRHSCHSAVLNIIKGDYLPVSCVIVCMSFLAAR